MIKVHAGVEKDSGLIHSVLLTAGNVHDLTPFPELLHGDEVVVYGDAGYQGIAKRPELNNKTTAFRVMMRPVKRRVLPDIPEGKTAESARDHQGPHPLRVIKQQFGFQKIWLPGLAKNRCKINVLAALMNLFLDWR